MGVFIGQVRAEVRRGTGSRIAHAGYLRIRGTGRGTGAPRALLAASTLAFIVKEVLAPFPVGDLKVYRAEGNALRLGLNLYGPLPGVHSLATYPPFSAALFVLPSLVPLIAATLAFFIANLALVFYISVKSFTVAGLSTSQALRAGMVLAAFALWLEPIYMTFHYGQVNLILLALVLSDFTRIESRWSGVATGLAAAIKVTPLLFVVYLVITRRYRIAGRAVVAFGAALAVSLCINARETWSYWTRYLFESSRMGRLENAVNQTVRGAAVRFMHTRDTAWFVSVAAGLILIAGMLVARYAYNRCGDRLGLTCAAVTGLLISPISWSHHWVWCIPILAVLWTQGMRRTAVFYYAIFASFAVWYVPHARSEELRFGVAQMLWSNWYVYAGIGYLLVTFILARRPQPAAPPTSTASGSLAPG